MREAVMARLSEATMVVMAAAVSDYRVRSVAAQKIKREGARVSGAGGYGGYSERGGGEAARRERWWLGLRLRPENALANGRAKLERKGVDAVVGERCVGRWDWVRCGENAGSFLTGDRGVEFSAMSKVMMADRILDEVAKLRG